jgi:hypothetical protein
LNLDKYTCNIYNALFSATNSSGVNNNIV